MEPTKPNQRTDRKFNYLTVPHALFDFAVRNNKFTSVQVYLAAKFLFREKFFDKDANEIANLLKRNPKTIKHHFNCLVELGWFGRNQADGVFHIRNWMYIRIQLKDRTRTGYFLPITRIGDLKAMAIAATYDRLVMLQKYAGWRKRRLRRGESVKKGSSKQTRLRAEGFYPVANAAYSSIYGLSESTASRYRKLAHQRGFIKIRAQYTQTNLPTDNRPAVEVIKEELGKQLVFQDNKYCFQEITLVKSNLIRRRIAPIPMEKTATINKGNV